jgi:hypothetical protein
LLALGNRACQHEVGEIRTGDEENEAGDPHQQVQVTFILLLHALDAGTAGAETEVLPGDEGVFGTDDVGNRALEELQELDLQLRLDGRGLSAGCDAADEIQPLLVSMRDKVSIDRPERGHQLDG